MGGVPMLLMVAALGVDYGWQPDGGGGVEYVIQVQPDQWERVKELGEISSVIDPQVQGRVSKVIIRVGNGPLPRSAPSRPLSSTQASSFNQVAGGQSNSRTGSSNDFVPVPIPEMASARDARPIPGGSVAGAFTATSESVMKPAPADSPSSGFALPTALQNVADSVAGAARGVADQVKQDMGVNGSSQYEASLNQLRANTAAATNAATSRSLDQFAASPAGGPSTAPVDYGRAPSSGLASNDATTRVQTPPFTGSDPTGMARARTGGPSTDPAEQSKEWQSLGSNPAATSNQNMTNPASGYGTTGNLARQPQSLRPEPTTNFASSGQSTNSAYVAPPATNQPPYSAPATTSANTYGDPSLYANPNAYGESSANATRKTDPRLTAAQLARLPAGAYSFNTDGVPVDENWIPVNPPTYATNPPASPSNPTGAWDSSTTAALGSPRTVAVPEVPSYASTASTYETVAERLAREKLARDRETAAMEAYIRDSYERANAARIAAASTRPSTDSSTESNRNSTAGQDLFPSSSDQRGSIDNVNRTGTSQTGLATKPELAPQKFFNMLLLCSIVGNFYLFFWLKNMRDHFRDLVTSKRMAQSNTSVA